LLFRAATIEQLAQLREPLVDLLELVLALDHVFVVALD
jgi:hypothetical protein